MHLTLDLMCSSRRNRCFASDRLLAFSTFHLYQMSPMDFKSIAAVVEDDFLSVDGFIRDQLKAHVPLINEVADYIVGSGGKRLRPLICLLAAKAAGYTGDKHVTVASTVEILHTATLLHDDVVDESKLRRGRATVNAAWGNATAVLIGDYLISRAFQLIVELKNQRILEIMANSTCIISEGEVLQLISQRNPDTTEQRYMDVIHGKTATMFEVAAEGGAVLGNPELGSQMALYAKHLGAAFQIIDDVLDYTSSADVMGKNVGDDLAEGKPTLPLIQAMKMASPEEVELIRNAIRTGGLEHLQEVIAIVRRTGALAYTQEVAARESRLAIDALAPIPDSRYKEALIQLAHLALNRHH